MITLIAAIDNYRAIGYENTLLFRFSDDLKRFAEITQGKVVVMGRKTYDSLPPKKLPSRQLRVVSRTLRDIEPHFGKVYRDLDSALLHDKNTEIIVAGGEEIYTASLPFATRLLITHINATAAKADAYFPVINPDVFRPSANGTVISGVNKVDGKTYDFRYVDYVKI